MSPQLAFAPAAFRLICRNQNCHRLPQTTTDCHRLPLTATDCHRLLLTATDSNTLQQTPRAQRLPQNARDCQRLPETARVCHRLPQTDIIGIILHQFTIYNLLTDFELSGQYLGFWIIRTFLDSLDSFYIVWTALRLSGKFPDCGDSFWVVQKLSGLSRHS